MPRIDYSAERPPTPAKRSTDRRGGLKIPGAYGLLREQERVYGGKPNPRWAWTEACCRGDPYPTSWRGSAELLSDLDSGRPVQVDWRRLESLVRSAGQLGIVISSSPPEGRVERFFWNCWQGRVAGVLVYSDDLVVPVKKEGAVNG